MIQLRENDEAFKVQSFFQSFLLIKVMLIFIDSEVKYDTLFYVEYWVERETRRQEDIVDWEGRWRWMTWLSRRRRYWGVICHTMTFNWDRSWILLSDKCCLLLFTTERRGKNSYWNEDDRAGNSFFLFVFDFLTRMTPFEEELDELENEKQIFQTRRRRRSVGLSKKFDLTTRDANSLWKPTLTWQTWESHVFFARQQRDCLRKLRQSLGSIAKRYYKRACN